MPPRVGKKQRPVCVICEDRNAYPNRPTCAWCDPDDCIKWKSDERVPALRVAFRMGGANAVLRMLECMTVPVPEPA